jgi:hypothetical protein
MRCYSRDEEERIRAQRHVGAWMDSGLLDRSQGERLEAELRVELTRTNNFLRAALAFFTVLIVSASVLFVSVEFGLTDRMSVAVLSGVAALVCIALAEVLVGWFRCYRFGVEEALAAGAVVLLSVCGALLASDPPYGQFGETSKNVALLIGAAGGFGLYRRFGFVYAAVGAMACAALIPLEFSRLVLSNRSRHLLAAALLLTVFIIVRAKRLRDRDDFPGDEYGLLQAAAWAGLYLTVNLLLGLELWFWPGGSGGVFYWFTYVMIWVLPIAGLRWGIREKDRELIVVSIVMTLVTLVTNKPYLGWPRNSWDPILLGLFLMAVTLALRRWLSSGPDGARAGFTATRVLGKDSARLTTILNAASTAFQPNAPASHVDPPPASRVDPPPSGFDGGRSGGAGGGAAF